MTDSRRTTGVCRWTAYAAAVTASAALVTACGAPASPTISPSDLQTTLALTIPHGGPRSTSQASVPEGRVVFVRVTSADATTVRITGQDAIAHLKPRRPATLVFVANSPGTVDVVIPGGHTPVASITVEGR